MIARAIDEAIERLMCAAELRDHPRLERQRVEMHAGLWCEDRATAIATRARYFVRGVQSSDMAARGWTTVVDVEREAAGLLLAGWRP